MKIHLINVLFFAALNLPHCQRKFRGRDRQLMKKKRGNKERETDRLFEKNTKKTDRETNTEI